MLRMLLLVSFFNLCGGLSGINAQNLDQIRLPKGFEIDIFAENIPGARSLAISPAGILFVSAPNSGKVYALIDKNQDGKIEKTVVLATRLNAPNGLAFFEGDLYVAEIDRILRFKSVEKNIGADLSVSVIFSKLPNDRHHGYRVIGIGPDKKLYVGIGAPCNVCLIDRKNFGVIKRLNLDGTEVETFAYGVRNTVGFDWDPITGELWFNDHGRDWLGDDLPSDELNHAPVANLDFGFPYCHQGDLPDPEFGSERGCEGFVAPQLNHGAHVAPDGLIFYTGKQFPSHYENSIFVAQHGSWNRKEKNGYRVTVISRDSDGELKSEVFADGWEKNNTVYGRPVDLIVSPSGDLLLSDDQSGVIYRIFYGLPDRSP